MAISTDAAIEFFGTTDTVTASGGTSTVADDSFSVVGDAEEWTNNDDAVVATAVLTFQFTTAPDLGSVIELYARLLNIEGTNDQSTPSDDFPHVFLGGFPVEDVTSSQFVAIDIGLPNTKSSQEYEFYVANRSGQTMNAGWALYITPKAIGPHP